MVTNSQDYKEMLWEIQNNTTYSKAILLPKDEPIYEVDLDSRVITPPKFLSVSQDHQAETVYFQFDRYYENVDLTTKICIIQYRNANGQDYIYPVPYFDTETLSVNRDKVLIPWCVQGPATAFAGDVQFAIRFFKLNENKEIIYDLNTLPTTSEVLEGQDWALNSITGDQLTLDDDFLLKLQKIEEIADSLKLYWTDNF